MYSKPTLPMCGRPSSSQTRPALILLLVLLPAATIARPIQQPDLPPGFDWQAYKHNYPDLSVAGTLTEEEIVQHWHTIGAPEGRVYRPVHKLVRYTACTGLFNQYYSHISALALAAVLHADIYFPPAATRSSYSDRTSLHPEQNEARWQPVPAETLWDVRMLKRYWRQRGINVFLVWCML